LTAVVKLFLKRPDQSQGLVQKVLQAATAESDNPDIRDRAYVYWRLLSSDPQITRKIVLSDRPPITSTISSLPPVLLDDLLKELSTLASVYHKPAAAFLGHGRFASDAVQQAAIEEAQQNARENPIAASAVAAAVSGGTGASAQTMIENLLDFDADGAIPASLQKEPAMGSSGLEGLAGTPMNENGPRLGHPTNTANDLAGVFGEGQAANGQTNVNEDMMSSFGGLDLSARTEPPPPQQQLGQGSGAKASNDLLDLM
jgi:AP-1 complex subunit beta-1